ncbi:MAG: SRPBCC family protein [Gemmatimonadota bacterium]|nr:SRPBCC family protein [Gemmatimonadota bacterium]
MRTYEFLSEQTVRAPVPEVFAFLADARNLDALTPAFLRFRIVTPMPVEMRPGLSIDYRLRFRGIPLPWRSEITDWEPHRFFAYEQRRGPYRFWRHEHVFGSTASGGARTTDRVLWSVAGGPVVRRLVVERHLERIFESRNRVLRERFGA